MMKVPGQDAVGSYINNSYSQKKRLSIVRLASKAIALLSNRTSFKTHLSEKICVPFLYICQGWSLQ